MEYRKEHDSMGEVLVPSNQYWGAQTQRSLENFNIGCEKMPVDIINNLFILKLACARANHKLKPEKMTKEKLELIEIAFEKRDELIYSEFPLSV